MKKRFVLADNDAGVKHMLFRVVKSERYEVVLAIAQQRVTAKDLPKILSSSQFTACGAESMNALRDWNLSPFRHKGGLIRE